MASYRLNDEALDDLDRLYVDGIITFGLEQADRYYDGLIEHFQNIADTPYLWQAVDHIRQGYRRSVYGSHSIYYRVSEDMVDIMRILKHENTENL